jgi:hypothetical protein
MITGAHSIIYSTNPEADRAFFRDILKLNHVDVGGGWLIFGLPPAEVAVHPGRQDVHEFYLICEDVESFITRLEGQGVTCAPVENRGWGLLTQVALPGGGSLGVYQPRHARPEAMRAGKKPKAAKRTARKARDKKPR